MDMLDFLYHTIPGRMLLKPLTAPALSRLCGRFLDSSLSHFLVRPFIRTNNIRIEDYETDHIRSFNDFFSRKICEGLLSVWKIEKDTVLPVKQSSYTLTSLLRSHKLARHYEGGYCLVFRLCVNHYHRYCYVDSGAKSRNRRIPGVLHTVRPVALASRPVFTENSREYTLIRTDQLGTIVQMEVGAMLVGRIVNHEGKGTAVRGSEKGFFQYGGSTIILLTGPGKVQIDPAILKNSSTDNETPVKLGEVIGHAKANEPVDTEICD